VLTVVSLFSVGNLSSGEREDRSNRWGLIAFGVLMILIAFLPAYTDRKDLFTFDGNTIRWLGVVFLAAGGALRLWPTRPPVQRTGSHPAWTYAGYQRHLQRHPQSQLFGHARKLAGLGACFSFRSRRDASGASDTSADCAYARRGEAAACALWWRVRGLPRSHVAADSESTN
jgi:hypothetical protein